MNLIPKKQLPMLDVLWNEARELGRVNLFTMDSGKYHACIKFDTIPGTELKASSGHDCKSPSEALSIAIDKAKAIRNQFKGA